MAPNKPGGESFCQRDETEAMLCFVSSPIPRTLTRATAVKSRQQTPTCTFQTPTLVARHPRLILAPMEVLADWQFRGAIAAIGGMDEAVHEFMRIPDQAELTAVRGALRRYDPRELGRIPLAAQVMGGDPAAMGLAAAVLADAGAPRIDLNCGCPSRRVTSRGAGSSLLKEPRAVYDVVREMVCAVEDAGDVPVSVKMRSGFDSIRLLEDNVRAVVEGGARMITLHPRTKVQGYKGSADWGLIARVKELVGEQVEVVGNGDVTSPADAKRMLHLTACDHLMIGRGAVRNPWIFWEIREALREGCSDPSSAHLSDMVYRCLAAEVDFYTRYLNAGDGIDDRSSPKTHKSKIGRLKMLVSFASRILEEDKFDLLRSDGGGDAREFLNKVLNAVSRHYAAIGEMA